MRMAAGLHLGDRWPGGRQGKPRIGSAEVARDIHVTGHAAQRMRERFPGVGGVPLIRDEVRESLEAQRVSKRCPEWASLPHAERPRSKMSFTWPESKKRCYVIQAGRIKKQDTDGYVRTVSVLKVLTVLPASSPEKREKYKRMRGEG